LAFTDAEEKNLENIYTFLSATRPTGEKYDAKAFIDLALRWPEAQRFPRE
jgi:hypothetical protein